MFWSLWSLPSRSSIPQLPSFCFNSIAFPLSSGSFPSVHRPTCLSIFKTTVTSTTSHDLISPSTTDIFVWSPSQGSISKNDLYLLSWLFNSSWSTLQSGTGPQHFTTTELLRVPGDNLIVKQCSCVPSLPLRSAWHGWFMVHMNSVRILLSAFLPDLTLCWLPSCSSAISFSIFSCLSPFSLGSMRSSARSWFSGLPSTNSLTWQL